MNKWLIKKLILDKCGSDERAKRLRCGRVSGVTGIVLYAAFGLIKIIIGLVTGSFAVIVDAIHNLADASASIATLIGFSMANKASDREHPFGHARIEYMTGFIVSAIIIGVGIELCITAFDKMKNPTPLSYDTASVVCIVILSIVVLWFSRFNIKLSKLINSASLKATSVEARNDFMTNIALIAVLLLDRFANVNIDGYAGLAFGVIIIYSGIKMVTETAGPLLGQSPDPGTVKEIAKLVLGQEGVLGIHDLIVHDYGPGHVFASVHIEVDSREDVFISHELVDDIERKAHEDLRVFLVGHMDPLDTQNPRLAELNEALTAALQNVDGVIGIHDLRLVVGPVQTNVIFDVVAAHDDPDLTFRNVEKVAHETLKAINPGYVAVVNRDLDYIDSMNGNGNFGGGFSNGTK